MDFILNEAIEEDNEFKLVFSDDTKGEPLKKSKKMKEKNYIL